MRKLVYGIINSIKNYAEVKEIEEKEVFLDVADSLLNYIMFSSIEPIFIKNKEVENE